MDATEKEVQTVSINPPLTIKTSTSSSSSTCNETAKDAGKKSTTPSDLLFSPSRFKTSIESSPYNSPLISPPSSAFVSALQSPYISPRMVVVPGPPPPPPTTTTAAASSEHQQHPSPSPPVSYCGSLSDDIPSTSYTPPPERFDFLVEYPLTTTATANTTDDEKMKLVTTCIPQEQSLLPPRISFSFPIPRVSFAKGGSVSPSSNTKLRSCDVYIGYYGQNMNLIRFCKWLKSELEHQGVACFVADRAKYSDNQSHEIADRIICSATFGVVVVTSSSFLNHLSIEEIRFFAQKKNLIPLLFDTDHEEITNLLSRRNSVDDEKDWKEAVDALIKSDEFKLEANDTNWRGCASRASGILRTKLGRKSDDNEREAEGIIMDELPFRRNRLFVGREKELMEIENSFFGCTGGDFLQQQQHQRQQQQHDCLKPIGVMRSGGGEGLDGISEGLLADEEESDYSIIGCKGAGGRYISMDVRNSKEPTLEAWVEPPSVIRRSTSKRPKHKKSSSKNGNNKNFSSVVGVTGVSGVGKTELALEFAFRYRQRYKMVLWVGGEARYFRQNILNMSIILGLDVSAEAEKERGRIRSFEEQEFEAFQRVKREIFRDMPYLLIIDNLETESEWWEGKDLHDLIPRNTGASHVIITTGLSNVMSLDLLQLSPLPSADSLVLIRGRRKDYPTEQLEILRTFEDRLRRSSFGLWVIGSLLSELAITPSALFEAVSQVSADDHNSSFLSAGEEQFFKNNPFLMRLLTFCSLVLERTSGRRNLLASRMLLAGAWFAPAPIPVNLLAITAKKIPAKRKRFGLWTKCLKMAAFCCCTTCCSPQIRKIQVDSALLLVKLGLAKRTNRRLGCWIQFHPIAQSFARLKGGLQSAKATVECVRQMGNPVVNLDHLWASAFLVFGFKSEPPLVQLKADDMVIFIKNTALPLALQAFTTFSRCNSALELLKVCTNILEEVEKSFASQVQDWCHGSLCWKKKTKKLECSQIQVDEYVWQDVMLLKAALLETRAKLLLRGGHFDSGEELCRTCISIRTVMLGHKHPQTLAAQETLARLVRMRSKM
ncbi:hypothetical protein MKX01_020140 [Papaver californicum]|nr:hypothetical protein MKX01_020140 [Papaver californicum]